MDQNWCKRRNMFVWAITKIIFNYTGSPREKISQKVLGGYLFDSHCIRLSSLYSLKYAL